MSQADDFVLVSVDDHLIEPPDLFAGHLPAQYLRVNFSPSRRVLRPDEKVAQFRGRAERAAAAAAAAG